MKKNSLSRRRRNLNISLVIRRESNPETDANTSNAEYGETRSEHEGTHSKVDYRIQGIPHAAVKQEDDAQRQLISRLVYQIKNHPNKDALIADLQQNHPYNPILSAKSQKK